MKHCSYLLLAGALTLTPVLVFAQEPAEDHGQKKKAEKSEPKKVIRPPNEGAPKASESGGQGGSKVYVSIGPIILPVITDDGPQQIITMVVSLQVDNTNDSDKVREKFPKLVDAYMRALYGKLDASNMHGGTIVNVDYVKRKLIKATTEIMGPDIVEDVLIQAIAQRMV